MISTSPSAGATGVSQSVVVTATFSEAMDPTTLNVNTFVLRNSSNVVVPANITYTAATRTATLTPNSPLAASATYTANLTTSVKDLSGNALANLTWSFSTAATPSCPCTIWSSSATPLNPSVVDPNPVELGVKVKVDLNGFITGARFTKAQNTGVHVGNLWNSAGQLLATGKLHQRDGVGVAAG